MKFNLPSDKVELIKSFIASNIYSSRDSKAYSAYWEEHARKMSFSIEQESVKISGGSGSYIPGRFWDFDRIYRWITKILKTPYSIPVKIKILIKEHIGYPRWYMSWNHSFDAVMKDVNLSNYRVNHVRGG